MSDVGIIRFSERKLAVFTICSLNYLGMAEVLLKSVREQHPEADLFVCLADEINGYNNFSVDNVEIVESRTLGIDDFEDFSFRYDIMEFNTAVKPFMIKRLLNAGYHDVLYFDPDIRLYSPLASIRAALAAGSSFVLTPHLCQPDEGVNYPGDIGVMQAGVYNLGFIGVGRTVESAMLIDWWCRRLRYGCINNQPGGVFVDQKYMDLVPAYASRAHVLRDTNLNVAYWNLGQRTLSRADDSKWLVDGRELGFFHFSGISIDDDTRLSKHTQAFRYDAISAPLRKLCADYVVELKKFGHGALPNATYAYGRFSSGTPIVDVVRNMYRDRHATWGGGNPFETYEEYLHLPAPGVWQGSRSHLVTNLMMYLWQRDVSVRVAFDIHTEAGVKSFVEWYCRHGIEMLQDSRYIEPVSVRRGNNPGLGGRTLSSSLRKFESDETRVTVVGYLRAMSGVGQCARQTLTSLHQMGVLVEGVDVALNVASSRDDGSAAALETTTPTGKIQIFHINADQLPLVLDELKGVLRQDAYKIIVPFWELSQFPAEWTEALNLVDEIWAPTRFIQLAIANAIATKPVVHMPIALDIADVDGDANEIRGAYGLGDNDFIFLFTFDFLSFPSRKNPEGVIEAFLDAFQGVEANDKRGVPVLIVKSMNGQYATAEMQRLQDLAAKGQRVIFINETFSRERTLALVRAADCIVSLHRSEGLGLLAVEALLSEKPVISTDYSATTEFITPETGYPVDYRLIPVPAGAYPYSQGQVWAEPDKRHAAWQMREVFFKPAEAKARAMAGRKHILNQFDRHSVSLRQLNRLKQVAI